MRQSQNWALALALAFYATTSSAWNIIERRESGYSTADQSETPRIPEYNISMPVDHFNASDTRTYNNRFFVNDTYYKPGGPVILFDYGESGIDNWLAAVYLSEWKPDFTRGMSNSSYNTDPTLSAPIQLAKVLNGVVIGWEHRYYGYSRPVPVANASSLMEPKDGIPDGGAQGYKYFTIEQALEDVVSFANNFNKTQLNSNNTVLGGENGTQHLGPWQTPWVWVGGSYPGNRGAWLRERNPEIIYAVWAASAPVQAGIDGSAYSNAVYRALPRNCTADIQVAAKYIDNIISGGNKSQIMDFQTAFYSAFEGIISSNSSDDGDGGALGSPVNILDELFDLIIGGSQSYGYKTGMMRFCNAMESFNTTQYLSNASISSSSRSTRTSVFLWNHGDASPPAKGIAASNPGHGPELAYQAYMYAVFKYVKIRFGSNQMQSPEVPITQSQDLHSWEWQVLSEIGNIVNNNASSPLSLGSAYITYDYRRLNGTINPYFQAIPLKDIPPAPNGTYINSFGGWNMRPSNVMFTNGELDPWRAYGVMSPDQDGLGAPLRRVTQDIPQCGEAPPGTDVFGLLYGGAVHCEDMAVVPGYPRASEETVNFPVRQGVELFSKAYNAWLPCFNSTRGQTAGDKKTNGAQRTMSLTSGIGLTLGVLGYALYHS